MPLAYYAGRALVVVFAAALIWYGAMLVLLAFKVAPGTVNSLSGYRDAYDYLNKLTPVDITNSTRITTAIVGVLLAGVLGYLTWRELPRPHLARTRLRLDIQGRGETEVGPRAIERAVEIAALAHPEIVGARARYQDGGLVLDINARHAVAVAQTLREAQQRALDSLALHKLDTTNINVTLAAFDRTSGRDLK